MKWVIVLLMIQSVFAIDLFTLSESRRIDKYVKAAVNKKYTPQYLKQVERQAVSKYPLYKVGDKFTVNNGGKHHRGTIYKITQDNIQVGSHNFSTKDYPKHYFDKVFNYRARLVYVDRNFKKAKAAYQKKAEEHYKNKTLEGRPPVEQPAIAIGQRPALVTRQEPVIKQEPQLLPNKVPDDLTEVYLIYFCGKFNPIWNAQNEYTFTEKYIKFQRFGEPLFAPITSIQRFKKSKNTINYQKLVVTTQVPNKKALHWILTFRRGGPKNVYRTMYIDGMSDPEQIKPVKD